MRAVKFFAVIAAGIAIFGQHASAQCIIALLLGYEAADFVCDSLKSKINGWHWFVQLVLAGFVASIAMLLAFAVLGGIFNVRSQVFTSPAYPAF